MEFRLIRVGSYCRLEEFTRVVGTTLRFIHLDDVLKRKRMQRLESQRLLEGTQRASEISQLAAGYA
jgi:hypothetical protein